MDGVIVDDYGYHLLAWKKFLSAHGIDISEDELKNVFFGRTNQDIFSELFDRGITLEQLKELEEEKERLFRKIYRPFVRPLNGLPQFLTEIRKAGVRTAVATSAPPANARFILKETRLGKQFDVVTDASEIHRGKPDPEIYLRTSEKLRVMPARCVVFEDSLNGARSAAGAGMKVIGVTTSQEKAAFSELHGAIGDFTEIGPGQLLELARK